MFQSAPLILLQDRSEVSNLWGRWLEIKLLRPKPNIVPEGNPEPHDMIERAMWASPEYTHWGRYAVRANSVTGLRDDAYYIGTSANPQYKIWRWTPNQSQLVFTEVMAVSSGPDSVLDTLVLNGCRLNNDGISTITDSGTGRGTVLVPSLVLRRVALTWDPEVYF